MLGTGRSGVNENDTTMDTATPKFTDFVNFRRLHPAGSEGVHRRSANCSICQRKMSLTSEARCIGASSACSAEQESARELLRHFCGYRVERTCSGWSCTCCYQRLFMALNMGAADANVPLPSGTVLLSTVPGRDGEAITEGANRLAAGEALIISSPDRRW